MGGEIQRHAEAAAAAAAAAAVGVEPGVELPLPGFCNKEPIFEEPQHICSVSDPGLQPNLGEASSFTMFSREQASFFYSNR